MILDEIVNYKREFVAQRKRVLPQAELKKLMADAPAPLDFAAAITRKKSEPMRVISEVKKASPSKGVIREDFDPVAIAADYAEHQTNAISVLTDEKFFRGHLDFLRQVRREVPQVPLLRKDFTIDEYQIFEAREAGASAVLLITGILDRHQLVDYRQLANELGMAALTEVHLEREADLAAELGAPIIGINNRDLRTFQVDLHQTQRIMELLGGPQEGFTFVAESGIRSHKDVEYLHSIGADAILVGESLMREKQPGKALERLLGRDEESLERQA